MIWPSLRPFCIGGEADPYLKRWFILPRNRLFCIYLHQMLRDDDDRALHDHPGNNISIVLKGGYDEHFFTDSPRPGERLPQIKIIRARALDVICRAAAVPHRLSLPAGVESSWSLFIVFRKFREWGFWCPQGKW